MDANIIFDADNTLWDVEKLYDKARTQFAQEMDRIGLGPQTLVENLAKEIDRKNFELYALSPKRFPKSLVDTYIKRCETLNIKPDAAIQDQARGLGESVFTSKTENYPHVLETLQTLKQAGGRLYLWTQGDEAVQKRRIAESGLGGMFEGIEIDDSKTVDRLKDLLARWGLDRKKTWMVGNSLKSDIETAVAADLQAVWIPAETWNEENTLPDLPSDQVYLLAAFPDLPEVFLRQPTPTPAAMGDVVYLFVSAYHNLYRQYVLDILANPRDFTIRFPYRAFWLPGPYKSETLADITRNHAYEFCAQLAHKPALIVFTDERVKGEPRRSPNFLPIRAAVITAAELHGELVQIEFTLSDYVSYPDPGRDALAYDQFVKSLPYHPTLNRDDCAYIALGPKYEGQIRTEHASENDDAAWESTVSIVGDLRSYSPFICNQPYFPTIPNPFQYAMFYRLHALKNLKTGDEVPIQSQLGTGQDPQGDSGYLLESDTQYRLGLLFFVPKRPESQVRQSQVEVKVSPESVLTAIGQTEIPLNFTYDHRNVDFATARTFEDARGSIALSISSPDAAKTDERTQPMAPSPLLLVKVQSNRTTFWFAAGILFLGTFASSLRDPLSELIAAAFPALAGGKTGISVGLGFAGSILTTGAVYYLYHSLK